jgi:hypothetical protein
VLQLQVTVDHAWSKPRFTEVRVVTCRINQNLFFCTLLPASCVIYWSQFLSADSGVRVLFPVLPNFLRSSLERGPLSLVNTIEELLESKTSCFDLENDINADHATLRYPEFLSLTSLTSGGLSIGIVHSLTKAEEFVLLFVHFCHSRCLSLARIQYAHHRYWQWPVNFH